MSGRDSLAEKFLRELIDSQTDRPELLVKSLCNIASKYSDMFRPDFEYRCLKRALAIERRDTWANIQFAAYLYRSGDSTDSERVLTETEPFAVGENRAVLLQYLARIWIQRKNLEKARSIYLQIPGWENDETVRVALARLDYIGGDLEKAESQYDEIIAYSPGNHRALAGKAEVAKCRGMLDAAIESYRQLVSMAIDDERTKCVYQSALAHVLKLKGNYDEAFGVIDDLVCKAPFMMQARVSRAAILGLLGKASEGLISIPDAIEDYVTIEGWIQPFIKGLLLLKLNRNRDAKSQLLDKYAESLLSEDSETLVRLGAALYLMISRNPDEAEQYLSSIPQSINSLQNDLTDLLRLHVAMQKDERGKVNELLESLKQARTTNTMISAALSR